MISKPFSFPQRCMLPLTLILCLAICFHSTECAEKPQVALIFDDFGFHPPQSSLIQGFLSLEIPYAVSIIPGLEYSTQLAETFHQAGKEVIIHMPMESFHPAPMETLTLMVTMDENEIRGVVFQSIFDIPHAKGMSNHQGSRFTSVGKAMLSLLPVLNDAGLYFIDSWTYPESIAFQICRQNNIPALRRDIFLDTELEENETTADRFAQLFAIANKKGYALGIGHNYRQTMLALIEFVSSPISAEVEFVYPSQLIEVETNEYMGED